ncbi:uncharacterized protein [Nicotiana tomentosiformis]|uniref:uncharacterized protein n=1 Tax=Nicotiana tomentosiformis TaxID=4098 RepID=UPI00388C9971
MKKLNLEWVDVANLRVSQLNAVDEFRFQAYESASLYKQRMKYLNDKKIMKREFHLGDLVVLYNSRFKLFPGKLKSKWSGPFKVVHAYPFGVVDLESGDGKRIFKVNGQRIRHYLGSINTRRVVSEVELGEPPITF